MFREDPHAERGDELQNDRRRDVLDAIEELQREPAERWADDKAACDRQQEGRDDLSDRECVCGNSAHRQTVDQERVASLRRLSPSRIVRIRCGGRSGLSTAVAATASGGATMAPSAIAAAHGIAGISE